MKKEEKDNLPFSELHHVTIAVDDIERATKYYESLGIGPFEPYHPMQDYARVYGIDRSVFYNFKVRAAKIGPVFLQLVEPPVKGKSMYREFLDKRGEGGNTWDFG